jgi:hypothetical protein
MKLKRVLVIALMVSSVVFFVGCVACIAGVWALNSRITDATVGVLQPVADTLSVASGGIDQMSTAAISARQSVEGVQKSIEALGQKVADTNVVMALLSKLLNEDLTAILANLEQQLEAVRQAVDSVNGAIEAINALPFVNVTVPGTDLVQGISDKLAEVQSQAKELSAALQQKKAELAEGVVTALSGPTTRISEALGKIESALAELSARLDAAHGSIVWLIGMIPVWLDIASIIATVWLVWNAAAQVGFFLLGRYYLHRSKAE